MAVVAGVWDAVGLAPNVGKAGAEAGAAPDVLLGVCPPSVNAPTDGVGAGPGFDAAGVVLLAGFGVGN